MRGKTAASALVGLLTLALLAACGGGGGGSPLPAGPSSNPGGSPPPSSSSPSPSPKGSGTPGPTPSTTPADTPTPGPSPTHTPEPTQSPMPTPSPTQSPVPTPSPTHSPAPTPSPTPSPRPSGTPFAYSWLRAGGGSINGEDSPPHFVSSQPNTHGNSGEGNLKPGDVGALPAGGGQGPAGGGAVDGITCDTSMSDNYHVHAFVGLYVNGKEIAIPDAVGMVNPFGEFNDPISGWPNQEIYADCFYHIHTHDASGLVHLEDPNPTGAPLSASIFTTGNMFDVWGVQVNALQFGEFSGPVTVYTSGQSARLGCTSTVPGSCEVGATEYSLWSGDPAQIPMYAHEVIWYEVGSGNPDAIHLPGINFDTEH